MVMWVLLPIASAFQKNEGASLENSKRRERRGEERGKYL
jgi:hypothetical protein